MLNRILGPIIVPGILLGIIALLPAADPPPKEEPKPDALQREMEDYQFFFGEPKNIPEFWAAIQYEMSVGRNGVAAMFLDRMLAFAATKLDDKKRAEEWVKFEQREGLASILALNSTKQWYGPETKIVRGEVVEDAAVKKKNEKARKDVAELIKQVNAAYRAYAEDPVRIAKYVGNLTASPEEREYALAQLYESGAAAIPELVSQLQKAEHGNTADARLALRDALPKLSTDTVMPLLAALDSNDPLLQIDVMDVVTQRADKRAIPRLWWLLGNPDEDPAVRSAARKTLAVLQGIDPKKVDALPLPKEMLVQQAENYYQHRIEFADPAKVPVWRWDSDAKKIVPGWEKTPTLTATRAEEYWGHRYASQALAIDSAYQPAQIVDLSLIVDKAVERAGLDVSLSQVPEAADVHKVLMSVNPDLIIRVLERALNDKRTNVILATVRALGDLGEIRATRPSSSGEAPLLKALNYGDRRVEFAAAEAFLRIPVKPEAGAATRIIETLRRALAVDQKEPASSRKILVGYANEGLGQIVELAVKGLGLGVTFEPVSVRTGRDVLRRLNQAADIDAILIDGGLPDPGLANLIAQLRADTHAAKLPVIVALSPDADEVLRGINKQHSQERTALNELTKDIERLKDLRVTSTLERVKSEMERHQKRLKELDADYARESARALDQLRRFVERNPNTWVVTEDVPLRADSLRDIVQSRVVQAQSPPLPDNVRKDYTERSIQWLARIAKNELPGYDIRSSDDLPPLVYDSLSSPNLSDKEVRAAIEIAGRLPNNESQRHLLVFFQKSARPIELRKLAGDELIRHIQQHTNRLGNNEIDGIFKMFKDKDLDKDLRPQVNTLVGLMQPDERTTGDRLKGFEPKISPPPPPPKEK